MDPLQSAYKKGHSTETALLKVQNDILIDIDNKHVAMLVMLDLSAAFDTIDHRVLLNRLKYQYIELRGKYFNGLNLILLIGLRQY